MKKAYIGDSVYCEFDGHGLILTTENGAGPDNRIYLESFVWKRLGEFVDDLNSPEKEQLLSADYEHDD